MVSKPINSIETTREFYVGSSAEAVIIFLLRDAGYYVIDLANTRERGRNGAPGARNNGKFITLPDLDIGKMGYRAFAEVKFKEDYTFTRLTGVKDHGIGLRNWKMYLEASKQFGVETLIFIYEGTSGDILFNSISNLTPTGKDYRIDPRGINTCYYDKSDGSLRFRIYRGEKMDPGGMVFFPWDSFERWGNIALLGDEIYKQLSFDDLVNIKAVDEGDKVFRVLRHHKGD